MEDSDHFGIKKDSKKVKMLDTSIILPSCHDVLPLRFRVAKEDATSITNNTKLELQEICDIHKEVQVEGQTVVDEDFMLALVDVR